MLLNCHSYFSLRYGTIPVQRLVQLGQEHNISAMALTDINNLSGVYEFITACQKAGIKPIVGTEIRDDNQLRYILIAKNQKGFGEIGRFLTKLNERNTSLSTTVPEFKDCYIIYPFASAPTHLKEDEYIGIRSEQLTLLYTEKWKSLMDKIVILHTINHLNEEDYNLHCILRAIDNNTLLSKLTDRDCAAPTDIFKTEEQLVVEFRDYPIIIENTKELINSCNYSFTFKVPRNKKHYTECKQTDTDLLEQLAYTGMINIYGCLLYTSRCV